MKKALDHIVETFGFINWGDYLSSAFHSKFMGVFLSCSVAMSTMSRLIVDYMGLKPVLVSAVILLLLLELFTGLIAKQKNENPADREFTSKKFSRFTLKAFMWSVWIYIAWSFRSQFIDTNIAAYELFDWIHTTLLVYMFFEYLVSVDENVAKIKGEPNTLLRLIIEKIRTHLNINKDELHNP